MIVSGFTCHLSKEDLMKIDRVGDIISYIVDEMDDEHLESIIAIETDTSDRYLTINKLKLKEVYNVLSTLSTCSTWTGGEERVV